jgi:hypothetical protein
LTSCRVKLPTSKAKNELPRANSTCRETGCYNKGRFTGTFSSFKHTDWFQCSPMDTGDLFTLQMISYV